MKHERGKTFCRSYDAEWGWTITNIGQNPIWVAERNHKPILVPSLDEREHGVMMLKPQETVTVKIPVHARVPSLLEETRGEDYI